MIPEPKIPEGVAPEPFHQLYWRAWHHLRFDRQYGALGGESRMSFLAKDAYARRYGIRGTDFEDLLIVLEALDSEWLEYVADKAANKGTT